MSQQEVYRRRNTNIHTLVSLPWQHVLNKIFLLENVFSLEWILGGSNCCCIVFNNCYFHDESTLALSECSSKWNNRYWSLFNENACLFSKHDYAFIVITDFFTVTKICFLAIKGKGESMQVNFLYIRFILQELWVKNIRTNPSLPNTTLHLFKY